MIFGRKRSTSPRERLTEQLALIRSYTTSLSEAMHAENWADAISYLRQLQGTVTIAARDANNLYVLKHGQRYRSTSSKRRPV